MAGAGSVDVSYEAGVDIAAMPPAARAAPSPARVKAFLRVDGFLLGLVTSIAAAVVARLSIGISQDTWLSLLAGRTIAHSGLPRHETLTYLSLGKRWIDQQWLAHLASYGVYRAGGLVLLGLLNV